MEAPFAAAGGISVHHTVWGSRKAHSKERMWRETIEELDLCLLNDGFPSFLRRVVLDVVVCLNESFTRLS